MMLIFDLSSKIMKLPSLSHLSLKLRVCIYSNFIQEEIQLQNLYFCCQTPTNTINRTAIKGDNKNFDSPLEKEGTGEIISEVCTRRLNSELLEKFNQLAYIDNHNDWSFLHQTFNHLYYFISPTTIKVWLFTRRDIRFIFNLEITTDMFHHGCLVKAICTCCLCFWPVIEESVHVGNRKYSKGKIHHHAKSDENTCQVKWRYLQKYFRPYTQYKVMQLPDKRKGAINMISPHPFDAPRGKRKGRMVKNGAEEKEIRIFIINQEIIQKNDKKTDIEFESEMMATTQGSITTSCSKKMKKKKTTFMLMIQKEEIPTLWNETPFHPCSSGS
ncbi:hypothetical protein VP01_348g2 [Puccinia sorghi]|uniref:Uncharacterized protein n=1 Tax=Puccinia sorghi TaxID=27349 RepID=A0A0L6UXR1_9BASI|nr:hypothetical protein VP01_348g2 [Puccinia sorghi]